MRRLRKLFADTGGTAMVEFAIIGPAVIVSILCLIGLGLLLNVQANLNSVAAMAARCGAIGLAGVQPCTTIYLTKSYAATTASAWTVVSAFTTADVTVVTDTATCKGANGRFYQVTIATSALQSLPSPINNITLSVTACFPRA